MPFSNSTGLVSKRSKLKVEQAQLLKTDQFNLMVIEMSGILACIHDELFGLQFILFLMNCVYTPLRPDHIYLPLRHQLLAQEQPLFHSHISA